MLGKQTQNVCVLFHPSSLGPQTRTAYFFDSGPGWGARPQTTSEAAPTSPLTRLGPAQLPDHRSKELEGREEGPGRRGQGRS